MLIPLAQLGIRLWRTIPGAACFSAFVAVVYYVDSQVPFVANAAVWSATCLWAVCADRLEPHLRVSQQARSSP
jgi:hypothetical protein